MNQPPGLDCNEVVELVTAYLEGALDPETTRRFDEHLAECPGCEIYLEQMRQMVLALGRVPAASLPDELQAHLLAAFREFPRGGRRHV